MSALVTRSLFTCALISALAVSTPASAQFRGLLGNLQDKVEQEIDRRTQQPQEVTRSQAEDSGSSPRLRIDEGFAFVPGATTLVADDFSQTPVGAMPATWKTNGSGAVVTVEGLEGRWLSLQSFATYKLAAPPQLPASFTIEFDLVLAVDSSRDVSSIPFGFTVDNSVRSYVQDAHNDGGIAVATLGPNGGSTVSSSATDHYHAFDFDYRPYANRIMHVSIAVEGDMMKVYLDRTKIADSKLFRSNPAKYFFISAPINMDNGANVLFGNFRIAH